eukprot:4835727-Prymnesium_polylepis.1
MRNFISHTLKDVPAEKRRAIVENCYRHLSVLEEQACMVAPSFLATRSSTTCACSMRSRTRRPSTTMRPGRRSACQSPSGRS